MLRRWTFQDWDLKSGRDIVTMRSGNEQELVVKARDGIVKWSG